MSEGLPSEFLDRLSVTPECWEWTGYRFPKMGYGQMRYGGKNWLTHRLAWTLANGPIPGGLCVCHSCDNPKCCRPSHLWLGTRAENNADKEAKGRSRHLRGVDHPQAKLTRVEVEEIRVAFAAGELQADIAARYGVTFSNVSRITRNITWKEVAAA